MQIESIAEIVTEPMAGDQTRRAVRPPIDREKAIGADGTILEELHWARGRTR